MWPIVVELSSSCECSSVLAKLLLYPAILATDLLIHFHFYLLKYVTLYHDPHIAKAVATFLRLEKKKDGNQLLLFVLVGGNRLLFIFSGASLSILVSWLLMLAVTLLFLLGGNVHTLVCEPWSSGELLKVKCVKCLKQQQKRNMHMREHARFFSPLLTVRSNCDTAIGFG